MVGSAGTYQPAAAARRSQARRRARPAYDAGVHLRPRLGPANSPSAARKVKAMRRRVLTVPPPSLGGESHADCNKHAASTARWDRDSAAHRSFRTSFRRPAGHGHFPRHLSLSRRYASARHVPGRPPIADDLRTTPHDARCDSQDAVWTAAGLRGATAGL